MNGPVSEETLHAFVDGELDLAEREALLVRIQSEPELAHRVCAVRGMRDMLKLAYAEPPTAHAARVRAQGSAMQRCALRCLTLSAGLFLGWILRGIDGDASVASAPVMQPAGLSQVSLAGQPDPNRVMLHVDSAAPERMRVALDEAERLLDAAEREGRIMQLEVVANSHGLTLLRAGMSPHADRIARMQKRHANLHWVACSQSIARFRAEGQVVELLPAVRRAPTAIGEIVSRLQQGWTYVRV
jgi:intracellular sulfur oxidation DsrE/DsrF family protein